jgi:hypothetical protein
MTARDVSILCLVFKRKVSEGSLADTAWADLFKDPVLTDLISTALKQNHDVRIAAERVLEARAELGIADSELLPTVDLDATFSRPSAVVVAMCAERPFMMCGKVRSPICRLSPRDKKGGRLNVAIYPM